MAKYPKNQRGEAKELIRQRYLRVYTLATEAEKKWPQRPQSIPGSAIATPQSHRFRRGLAPVEILLRRDAAFFDELGLFATAIWRIEAL